MKKFLATLLTFALLLSMLCLPAAAEGEGETVNLVAADFVVGADGTIPAKAAIAAAGDKTVVLTEDVTIKVTAETVWPVLGAKVTATIDGQGHKITFDHSGADNVAGNEDDVVGIINETSKSGLFQQFGGTLSNLYIVGINLKGTINGNLGCFASNTNADATLENVHMVNATFMDADLSSPNAGNSSGFFGQTSKALTMKNCSFNGTVACDETLPAEYHTGFFAGFVGRINGDTTFENCVVSGNIGNAASNYAAGFVVRNNNPKALTIKNSVNLATVTATADAAGFAVQGNSKAVGTIEIDDCINLGAVTGKNAAGIFYIGGNSTEIANILRCANFGTVTAGEGGKKDDIVAQYEEGKITTLTTTGSAAAVDGKAVSDVLVDVQEGARMRLSNVLENAGMRFDIAANTAVLNAIAAAGATVNVGSAMIKADTLGTNTADYVVANGTTVKQALAEVAVKDNGTYSAALYQIAAANYAANYVCVGYVEITVGTTTYTVVSNVSDAKNVKDVATAAQATADAAYADVLATFAK